VAAARPAYPVLLDQGHVVATLYDTVNVPAGIWIDEQQRIVRGPELASAQQRTPDGTARVPHERYLNALRDWVARGADSIYVRQHELVAPPSGAAAEAAAEAEAAFRLGVYLYAEGDAAAAIRHFKRAHALRPENWNYKRQAWNLGDAQRDYGTTMQAERDRGIPMHRPLHLPDLPA
jgi:Flp pilus assembly protein TadD